MSYHFPPFLELKERWINVQTLADDSNPAADRRLVPKVFSCDGIEISPVLDVDVEYAGLVINLGLVVN